MILPFSLGRLPRIEFGRGAFDRLATILQGYGRRVLLVTGSRSFQSSPFWERLQRDLDRSGLYCDHLRIGGEPSPVMVDDAVRQFAAADIDVVLGIGGGSALDAAKAIAGLLRVGHSVMDFLEGVGPEMPYQGPAVPLVAVPTTAGTGSEATRNAVLSQQDLDGFKKSFRDERLVAEYAVVDPELLATCLPDVIAANGMDAVTQLLESYVSLRANPVSDALALSGLEAAADSLLTWYRNGAAAREAQDGMAYASLLSGITLAQVGLGSVHGLASPLGAFYPIPHGVVCGTLVAAATAVNLQALRRRAPQGPALDRYARAAQVLCRRSFSDRDTAGDALVALLEEWTETMKLPGLSQYGLLPTNMDHVIAHCRGSSMKTNPIELSDDELRTVLQRCL